MTTLSNPFEIARETLRRLVTGRTPPTPDNYRTLYHEISGTPQKAEDSPDALPRSLADALPKDSPEQLRLARRLDDAIKTGNWEDYRNHLVNYLAGLAEVQKLGWSELIADLLRQWDARHSGLTAARKREALEHVLTGSGANPETLHSRLQNLLRAWGQGREGASGDDPAVSEIAEETPSTANGNRFLPELRELFAFTLETAIATQLLESPVLAEEARGLATDIRRARKDEQLEAFLARLKRFTFKLELLAEDQTELRHSLLSLLRLLVENMTELVIDDRWLHGQIEVVRDIIDQPLSQRALDDAERRLKEVVFKQSQLKVGLAEAREAIKHLLASFVDHLANFADATSGYHDKIGHCAEKISAANNITELENVIGEVMRETRSMQINALRSRDELRLAQQKVKESEARIRELESELENTSQLVRYDQLTGTLNRRGLEEMFAKEAARARRHETPLCLGLLDLDNFKKLNDTLGHEAGDQALIHLASVCRQTLRPQDCVARYGGEEFIILLPETDLDSAVAALTRLQRELTKRFFLHQNDKVLITFSAGVTELRPEDDQSEAIRRADAAMYQAKQSGKNRVVSAD
ncbi:diguanylate cyclase [Azonexus sp.]|uniref:GGDEF domain-containing protein n=1 Tax=Azonexus sp. TaxID=1872668 RepID=UPI0035AF4141